MKFMASSSELQKALQTVGGVISNSKHRPILENYLLEFNNSELSITASDGETTLITTLGVKADEQGKIAVPAKIFQDFLKTYSDQTLTLSVRSNPNSEGKSLDIQDDKDSFSIALDNENDYPKLPEFESAKEYRLPAGVVYEALNNTLFATSNDSLRMLMTGVLFEFKENETNFVATDSHRLVVYKRKDFKAGVNAGDFVLPKRPLTLLKSNLQNYNDELIIEFSENLAKFSFGNQIFITRLIDGKYPNYPAVIPQDNPNQMTVSRTALLAAIRRAAIMSNKSTQQIKFSFSGNILHLNAEDTEFANKAEMSVPCSYDGEDLNIGFSSRFLTEMLSVLSSEDVVLKMSLPNKPGLLEPVDGLEEEENIVMLSMPVIG